MRHGGGCGGSSKQEGGQELQTAAEGCVVKANANQHCNTGLKQAHHSRWRQLMHSALRCSTGFETPDGYVVHLVHCGTVWCPN